MPTYAPASGNISFSQVKSAFAGVTKFSDLRNRYFYTSANSYGRNSSSTISLSALRGRGDTANVVAGSSQYLNSGSVGPIGVVNSLAILVIGGGGGGYGGDGNLGDAGLQGAAGGTTTLASFAPAAGGQPSSANANGANGAGAADNYPPGGLNAKGTYRGGTGGRTVLTYNKDTNFEALAALFNTSLNATIGAGGAGGRGGQNFVNYFGVNYPINDSYGASGAAGTAGLVVFYWT